MFAAAKKLDTGRMPALAQLQPSSGHSGGSTTVRPAGNMNGVAARLVANDSGIEQSQSIQ
jgi:hypothetical protein